MKGATSPPQPFACGLFHKAHTAPRRPLFPSTMIRRAFLPAVCLLLIATTAAAQCEEDFPIFNISSKLCTTAADCPSGQRCEPITSEPGSFIISGSLNPAERDLRPRCNDYSVGFGEACDFVEISENRLPSPGCLQNQNLDCRAERDASNAVTSAKCVTVDVPVGGSCNADATCARFGPNEVALECIKGKCVEFGFVGSCVNGACSGGAECQEAQNDAGEAVNSCVKRAGKGEPCKGGRGPALNGFDCKRETGGNQLVCVPGEDAESVSGPGPGGIGGGFRGLGTCQESVEAGGDCGDGVNVFCTSNDEKCVNGVCTKA